LLRDVCECVQSVILWIFLCGRCTELFVSETNEDNIIQRLFWTVNLSCMADFFSHFFSKSLFKSRSRWKNYSYRLAIWHVEQKSSWLSVSSFSTATFSSVRPRVICRCRDCDRCEFWILILFSQRSVATHLRCSEIDSDLFIANFRECTVYVKRKSASIWRGISSLFWLTMRWC